MTSTQILLERHKKLAGKYGKALQALKEVAANFENIDSDCNTTLDVWTWRNKSNLLVA